MRVVSAKYNLAFDQGLATIKTNRETMPIIVYCVTQTMMMTLRSYHCLKQCSILFCCEEWNESKETEKVIKNNHTQTLCMNESSLAIVVGGFEPKMAPSYYMMCVCQRTDDKLFSYMFSTKARLFHVTYWKYIYVWMNECMRKKKKRRDLSVSLERSERNKNKWNE